MGDFDYSEYSEYFRDLTGYDPYPYQTSFANCERLPEVLTVPTGAGKTAAVILGWLWRRRFHPDESLRKNTPRRLVYCLPMRTLVEQTRENAIKWLQKSNLLGGTAAFDERGRLQSYAPDWTSDDSIAVTLLMGGEDADEWDLYPERDAIIIGTQDMLLSRALNRGYGMSRYRWPMHFGLLNNDCLWVMDEVQLMGVGVQTSVQMQAFREQIGATNNPATLWMSATVDHAQLETVDRSAQMFDGISMSLGPEDHDHPTLKKRHNAKKGLECASIEFSKENKEYARAMAEYILSKHSQGSLTLCIVNTVKRAQDIFEELLKKGRNIEDTTLLHSRFREYDRKKRAQILDDVGDRIVVATQVIEAGVDISARTLLTELAPIPSLIQRFGRCNRYGEYEEATVVWIDIILANEKDTSYLPYDPQSLSDARRFISNSELTDVSPESLSKNEEREKKQTSPPTQIIRKKDLFDLFDTTPDLTGSDIDVSRYIRDEKDKDIHVFWRTIGGDAPAEDIGAPQRIEMCSVSIGALSKYLKTKKQYGWSWDPLSAGWQRVNSSSLRPGQIVLLAAENGGYSAVLGWTGAAAKKKEPAIEPVNESRDFSENEEAMDDEPQTHIGSWILLRDHISDVIHETERIIDNLELFEGAADCLRKSAAWHDVGKAHQAFQNMLLSSGNPPAGNELWGKSANINHSSRGNFYVGDDPSSREERPYFRHELASALAWLEHKEHEGPLNDLIAYLIAAHHGKVRLSIRSIPLENRPKVESLLFARGIWHGDTLPAVPPILMDSIVIDLSLMKLGKGSWLERMLALRDDPEKGPFRLAFLESILRAADWRASKSEREHSV